MKRKNTLVAMLLVLSVAISFTSCVCAYPRYAYGYPPPPPRHYHHHGYYY